MLERGHLWEDRRKSHSAEIVVTGSKQNARDSRSCTSTCTWINGKVLYLNSSNIVFFSSEALHLIFIFLSISSTTIHALLFGAFFTGSFLMFLKDWGFCDLPIMSSSYFCISIGFAQMRTVLTSAHCSESSSPRYFVYFTPCFFLPFKIIYSSLWFHAST